MKRSNLVLCAAVLALGGQFTAPAQAAGVQWSVGVNGFGPGVSVGTVITSPAPVYVAPPGVVHSPPPPVYISPPPLYVPRPPAYVAPPPVYYGPPPPVYGPPMPPVYVPAAPPYFTRPVAVAAPVYVPAWGGYRHHGRR